MKLTKSKLYKMIKEEASKLLNEGLADDAAKIFKRRADKKLANYDRVDADGDRLQLVFIGEPEETDEDLYNMFDIPKGSFVDNIERGVREFFEDEGFKISDIHAETTGRGGPEHLFIDIRFRA